MHTTPVSLLERMRQPQETEAWTRFVELYTPLLFYWARQQGMQKADAADLVQELFAILVEKMPAFQYDAGKSFRGWLRQILLNKWRQRLRRKGEATTPEEVLDQRPGPDTAEEAWEREYQNYVTQRALKMMQSEFQPATWKACWEFVVSGRPAAEIASELGLTVGAVRAAKFRVLCRLRQELKGLLD